jgi:hypothetical protein
MIDHFPVLAPPDHLDREALIELDDDYVVGGCCHDHCASVDSNVCSNKSRISTTPATCKGEIMTRPRPIRYDVDTWLVMRNDPVFPKAIIRRIQGVDPHTKRKVEKFRVVTWYLESSKRQLVGSGYFDTLQEADAVVLYDTPKDVAPEARSYPTYTSIDNDGVPTATKRA